jgi:hypothetical protein
MHDHDAECSLAELVRDPLIRLIMKSDGVDPRSVEHLFERISLRRPPQPEAGRRREQR